MVTSRPGEEVLPDLDRLRDATLRSVLDRLVVVRIAVAPVLIGVQLLICAWDPRPWRLTLTALLLVGMLLLFSVEYWRVRRGWAGPSALPVNIVLMLALQLGVVVASGGVHSPFVVVLPMMALQTTLLFGPTWPVAWVIGPHAVVLGAVAFAELTTDWSPTLFAETVPAGWVGVKLFTLGVAESVAVVLGSKVRSMVGLAVADVVRAHEDERRTHAEHARELVTLGGEIAHELKNPLASVKGLAALLARDAEGRSAERLGILREEVDRMQGTLEAFLDLSRPLVPLSVEDVDLGALAVEVGRMCEGLVLARSLRFRVAGEGSARADRRKLRQVLVNLVQNAIEASPSGGEIEVRVAPRELTVADRGPGLPADLGERVFEAGVTTRQRGNGLGLAIARGLVEQHGGRLTLSAREGGGTLAAVGLP